MDPRIERTRTRLQDALLELARQSSLDEITVAEIVARAGVNRSSFYQHYPDKDVLLADALDRQLGDLAASMLARGASSGRQLPADLSGFIAHVRENAEVYRMALGPSGSPVVVNRLSCRIEAVVGEASGLIAADTARGVPVGVVAAALAGAVMAVIVGWLRCDPLPETGVVERWISEVISQPLVSWLGE